MLLLVLILQPEKFSHLTPCVYFRRVVLHIIGEKIGFDVLDFRPAGPDSSVQFSSVYFCHFNYMYIYIYIYIYIYKYPNYKI